MNQLQIYNEADTQLWFDMFRHGVLPASDAVETVNRESDSVNITQEIPLICCDILSGVSRQFYGVFLAVAD
jgi:hypothetical protein